jgi:hypothetical protein
VTLLGENFDFQPWIQVHKMGMEEVQKLLQPLQEVYQDTDLSLVWSE